MDLKNLRSRFAAFANNYLTLVSSDFSDGYALPLTEEQKAEIDPKRRGSVLKNLIGEFYGVPSGIR